MGLLVWFGEGVSLFLVSRARALAVSLGAIVGLIGWAPLALAEGDPAETYKALVKASVVAREAGDLERTASLLEQATRIQPAPNMLNNLGRIYEELGNYKLAVETYRRVTDDPEADDVLKRLDATRIELLTPRLTRAWIRLSAPREGLQLYAEGQPLTADDSGDLSTSPGPVALEWATDGGAASHLAFETLAAGQTHVLDPNREDATGLSRITWEAGRSPKAVVINGYTLAANLQGLSTIHLPPGRYAVEVRQAGQGPVNQSLVLAAGATHDLSAALAGAPAASTAAGPVPSGSDGGGPSLLGIGGGALGAAVGAALLSLAASDRSQVESATQGEQVTDITQDEAYRLQTRADRYSTAGAALLGVGAVAVTTTLVLWLLDDGPEEAAGLRLLPTPGGVEALWRF